jgi:hypothetical protein
MTVAVDEQTTKFIENAVNTQLQARSITMTSEDPDFLIDLYLGKQLKAHAVGDSHTGPISPIRSEEGTLILDFIDVNTKRMIWRGYATGVVRPDLPLKQRRKRLNTAVTRMLQNFPPLP